MLTDLLKYVFVLEIVLVLSYFSGFCILFYANQIIERKFLAAFANILCGLILIILVGSLIATRLYTVNLGLAILAGWYFLQTSGLSQNLKHQKPEFLALFKKNLVVLKEVMVIGFLMACYFYYTIYGIHDLPTVIPDTAFYSKVSAYIFNTGIESNYTEFIYPEDNGVMPYHYFELWLNAIITFVFSLNSLFTFTIITPVIGASLLWVGYCGIADRFTPVTIYVKILALLVVFTMGFTPFLQYLPESVRFSANLQLNSINHTKLFPVYLFLVAALLSFLYKNVKLGVLSLLVLPLVSFATSVAIFASLGGYVLYKWQVLKNKIAALNIFLPLISIALFLVVFYKISPQNFKFLDAKSSIQTDGLQSDMMQTLALIVTYFNYLVVLYGSLTLLIIAYWAIIGFKWHKAGRKIFILLLGIISNALIFGAFLNQQPEAIQIFWNIGIVSANVFFAVQIILIFATLKGGDFVKFTKILPLLLILTYSFYLTSNTMGIKQQYSNNYLRNVWRLLADKNPEGAFIKAPSDYGSRYVIASNVYVLGEYLGFLGNDYHTISLSVLDIPKNLKKNNNSFDDFLIRNTSFYKFVSLQKKQGTFNSIGQSQRDFIQKYKIEYLLLSREAQLPATLHDLVIAEVIDSLSGEKCYLLFPGERKN